MDAITLDPLLAESRDRQFWLKPIGFPKAFLEDHPDCALFESRRWTTSQIEICFAKTPAKIAVGAVLITYRIHVSKLVYVAERLPMSEWTAPENRPAESKQRWPEYIKTRNLTPDYGGKWDQYSLQPFDLAREYSEQHPEDQVNLGSINFGSDKVQISRGFAEFLIRRIRDLA